MPTFPSGGQSITVEVVVPTGPGPHPAVVVVHGTRGLNPPWGQQIRDSANDLAAAGFLVLLPHYFERTATPPSNSVEGDLAVIAQLGAHRSAWLETLTDCEDYAVGRGDVDSARLGLLGYSLGGHLALLRATAGGGRAIKAVVEFFAPIDQPPYFAASGAQLIGNVALLPPTSIHHGEADEAVPIRQSADLAGRLTGVGKPVEFHRYPNQGHGFDGTALAESRRRTATWLALHL